MSDDEGPRHSAADNAGETSGDVPPAERLPADPTAPSEPAGGAEPPADTAAAAGATVPMEPAEPAAEPDVPPPAVTTPPIGRHAHKSRHKPRRKAPWWELPALVALAIVIAILVKTFLIQPFYIPSESMEKTLHGCPGCSGDRMLISKIVYDFRDPHPGDIVVFNAPPGWDDEPPQQPPSNPILRAIRGFGQLIGFVPPDGLVLVKRVIAVGGQTVKGLANGDVYVSNDGPNGHFRKLDETYRYETGPDPRAKFGPITVPKGRLWVMGDHRDRSADSRYHCGDAGQDGPDNASCNVTAATVPIDDV